MSLTSCALTLQKAVKVQVEEGRLSDREIDTLLVERALSGETTAYRELVERYQSRIHAVAVGIMGNFDDAEEVTQEAFLKAFKNLGSFRKQSSFFTWLYRITFNLSIDEKRRRYRQMEKSVGDSGNVDVAMQLSAGPQAHSLRRFADPATEFQRGELRQHISDGLQKLSPEHRSVIVLREIEGLSYEEISQAVGCSKGTVMSRLHHARRKLQGILREALADSEGVSGSEIPEVVGVVE